MIRIEHLMVRFGQIEAVKDVSFAVDKGVGMAQLSQ